MTILIVEDDEITLCHLSHRLAQKGHHILTAENGRKAVDIVMDHAIDLVICDLMLPVISGVSFLRIRNKFMSPHIPVIAISVLENAEEILKEIGVNYGFFIKKPVNFDILLKYIEKSRHVTRPAETRPVIYI